MQKILVSACLLGEAVRYDGGDCRQDGLLAGWQAEGRLVAVCPEVAGGLPVPRPPAEIEAGDAMGVIVRAGRVRDIDGNDVTDAFIDGARQALELTRMHRIEMAILKQGSPSCGNSLVNDGTFSGNKIAGQGVTAALLHGNGVRVFNENELDAAADYLARLEAE